MAFSVKGDDANGYGVLTTVPGSQPDRTYVIKEDGVYKIVAGDKSSTDDNSALGNEVLWALDHSNPGEAKAMLDWKRDQLHKEGGDDVFSGPLLPRFWTINSAKPNANSPESMRLAAIALLIGSMDAKQYLAEISALRENASGQRQTDLDLLLALAALYAEDPATGMPAAHRLLEQEPDSATAISLLSIGYGLQNDVPGWLAMLAPQLARKPEDHDLLVQKVRAYEQARDWKAAKMAAQAVIDSGKATASDYNDYAWIGLFHNDLGDDITKAAQESNQRTKNSNFSELHTLACIYAAQGKTTQARKILDDAMYADNEVQPNSAVWYALGLIYEQYGAKAEALEAYKKVNAHDYDNHTNIPSTDTYVLARMRIEELSK